MKWVNIIKIKLNKNSDTWVHISDHKLNKEELNQLRKEYEEDFLKTLSIEELEDILYNRAKIEYKTI